MTETPRPASTYDLVIIGGTAGGLSVAISSLRSGLDLVRIVEPSSEVVFSELVSENELDIGYGEHVTSIDLHDDLVVVNTNRHSYRTIGCLVALRADDPSWIPPIDIPAHERITIDEMPAHIHDADVLVVGFTDHAVELVAAAAAHGARVVMAAGGMDPALLSPAGENMLRRLERERRATLLYRAVPDQLAIVDDYPIAYFDDRRTPDLEFDHVIVASRRHRTLAVDVGASDAVLATDKLWFAGRSVAGEPGNTAPGWEIGTKLAEACFPNIEAPPAASSVRRRVRVPGVLEELRGEHYNATITLFEPTHSDLWVLRVKPDHGDTAFVPGQYATLGLGFWEDRVDDSSDPDLDDRWWKLIRRSYSISHPVFDEHGYLAELDDGDSGLEFYIVLVPPTAENVPALTPRLALKRPGDRIYLGPKVAGRYTLGAVTDPNATVVFFSTGTGEAPHNAMAVELLRKGHVGPIVSAVTVRNGADLGYIDKHRLLEQRYPNYHYLPMPTREPDVPKRYLQDVIIDDLLPTDFGVHLDPASTHVFLCGNPAMIGLPAETDSGLEFPEPVGVVQLLTERGFTLDQRRSPGNIHYEEYW
ncbi:MAG: hypothetical protein ACR2P0_16845 [Acidimicrobiales bacterium]